MTEEELGEVPGIGEKSVEKIATSVRHYFEALDAAANARAEGSASETPVPDPILAEGEEAVAAGAASDEAGDEVHSMTRTPEEILAEQGAASGSVEEVDNLSTEDIADAEDRLSRSDANDDADAREEQIEMDNDTVDTLVDQADDVSSETIDNDSTDPGSRA